MPTYYVNKNEQPTGEHEVHTSTCSHKPLPENCQYLGEFTSCHGAVVEARKYYSNVDGCFYCCNDCHKK